MYTVIVNKPDDMVVMIVTLDMKQHFKYSGMWKLLKIVAWPVS